MAEALAAIGLASNILQFVEVGFNAMEVAYKLYKSPDDLAKADKELELLTRSLKAHLQRIQQGSQFSIPDDLQTMITTCGQLAEELFGILDDLKIDPEKDKRMETIKKTFKGYRRRQDIKDLT